MDTVVLLKSVQGIMTHKKEFILSMSFLFLLVNEMRAETWKFETGSDFRLKSQAVPTALSNYAAGWTDDMRLTSGLFAGMPHITNNASGIHIVCPGGTNDENPYRYQVKYMKSIDGGRTWGALKILSENSSGDSYPTDIISDTSGLHIVWYDERNFGDHNEEIYYRRSTDGGETWEVEKRLTNSDGRSFYPKMASDSNGLHVVWMDNRSGNYEVYYATSTDGGVNWGNPRRLTYGTVTTWPEQANIISDINGLHVFWPDERDGNNGCEIYYKRSADGGQIWTADQRLTFTSGTSNWPKLCADISGLHLAWSEYSDDVCAEVYYRRSTDGGNNWETPIRITNTVGYGSIGGEMVSDGNGLHMEWADAITGNGDIYYSTSTDGGASWSEAQRVTYNSESQAGRFTGVNGILHLVFGDERHVPTDGFASLYYKRYDPTDPTGKPTTPELGIVYDSQKYLEWAWTTGDVADSDCYLRGWHIQVFSIKDNKLEYDDESFYLQPGEMPSEMKMWTTWGTDDIGTMLRYRARVITENYRFSEWSDWSDAITLTSPLSKTYIYPNPVRSGNLTFTNLSNDAMKIKIYTITGELVKTINKDNSNTEVAWDLRNNSRRDVASGVYFYFIESGEYHKKGKIGVIR